MLWLLVAMAAEGGPVEQVAALFPGAAVTEVAGRPAIAPVHRNGEVGYILASQVSAVPVAGGRSLVAFGLSTQREGKREDWVREEHGVWTRLLQVVLLEADGSFVAKPEGFPLEEAVDVDCLGDLCDFGPRGTLEPVKDSTQWAVLRWHGGESESMGALRPLRVNGDAIEQLPDLADGSAGGLTGCTWTQEHQAFRESRGALKAMRRRTCGDGNVEECEQICSEQGYPLENVLSPVILAEPSP